MGRFKPADPDAKGPQEKHATQKSQPAIQEAIVAPFVEEDPNFPRAETQVAEDLPIANSTAPSYRVVSAPDRVLYNGQILNLMVGKLVPAHAYNLEQLRRLGVQLAEVGT